MIPQIFLSKGNVGCDMPRPSDPWGSSLVINWLGALGLTSFGTAKTSASSVEPLLLSRRWVQTRLAGRLALPFHALWK